MLDSLMVIPVLAVWVQYSAILEWNRFFVCLFFLLAVDICYSFSFFFQIIQKPKTDSILVEITATFNWSFLYGPRLICLV